MRAGPVARAAQIAARGYLTFEGVGEGTSELHQNISIWLRAFTSNSP
jgi:hypothetical protein